MNINEIIRLYVEEKWSLNAIANKYGTYSQKVKNILLKNNISIRSLAEQNKITNQVRAKKVNHNYFDNIDCCEKAWLIGFLLADGTVSENRNRIKIALSSVDLEILQKIKNQLSIEREILNTETENGFLISELAWSSGNHKCQLSKYGFVPKKTYLENHLPTFSNNIQYQLAFILGYFDGDGCFKDDGDTCRFEICSYRPEILIDISTYLNNYFQFKSNIQVYSSPSRKNYYTITYSTRMAEIILNTLYNLPNSLFLKRKYDKFMNWKHKNNRI